MIFAGMHVRIDDKLCSETVEDWSRVRSPSRAIRRRRQGHRQNIDYRIVPKQEVYVIGDTMIMHSTVARKLEQTDKAVHTMVQRIDNGILRAFYNGAGSGFPL